MSTQSARDGGRARIDPQTLDIQPAHAAALESLFPLEEFYCPPIEVLRAEVVQRGQFNLVHHASGRI